MKNLIIFSMLTVLVIINFSGCGKAQERPAKISSKISGDIVQMKELADITSDGRQDSTENEAFKRQLVAKIENPVQREKAQDLLLQNRLVYMLMEGKVVILEFIPANVNKHAVTASATIEIAETTSATLHTYNSLMEMKAGRRQDVEALKVSTWSQNRFAILTEIKIQTGILEDRTEYNEKKSIIEFTETPLAEAQVLILKSEIKTENTAKDDVSGVE